MDFQTVWSISRALGSVEGSSMSTGGTISSQEEVKCHQELRVGFQVGGGCRGGG